MHLPEELKSMQRIIISSLTTASARGREVKWTWFPVEEDLRAEPKWVAMGD